MQDNNINKIISNALQVNKDILSKNIKPIINQIQKALESNKEAIEQANSIDKKNNNGFILDFNIIKNIFSNLEKENIFYGDVTLSQKDEEKKIVYGTQIMDYGNVVVITDGNPYTIIEMVVRNIMAGNTTIFSNNGFMFGTNQLLIQIIQSVLEQFNISKYLVQIYVSENFDELLSNFANIDLVVCIGNHSLQNMILNKSKNRTIVSGYENFDLYIEDTSHIEFLNKIVNTGLNIQLYINSDTKLDHSIAIIVNDVNEAIAQINYNGSKYSSAIFTTSTENASKFVKEVKSKIVTINTSPTIERIIDIKQTDLINEKTIIYPFNFKLDGNRNNIEL
jgi:gamma-glutamyl phosphate reductase